MTKTAIAIGGNTGNVAATFAAAMRLLTEAGLRQLRHSNWLRTAPVDCAPGTADFLNGALTGDWPGDARTLLRCCQAIEERCGRPAEHGVNQPRTLDLDLILLGEECCHSDELTLPHPRARQRRFVLAPLAEIAADWRFPDSGESVAACLARLPAESA